MGYDVSRLSFLRTSLHFYSALAILEPQIDVIVKKFGRRKYLAAQRASCLKTGLQKLGVCAIFSYLHLLLCETQIISDITSRVRIFRAVTHGIAFVQHPPTIVVKRSIVRI